MTRVVWHYRKQDFSCVASEVFVEFLDWDWEVFLCEEGHHLGMHCGYVCKWGFLCSRARVHKTPYVILPRTPLLICCAQTWLHRGLLLCFINMRPCCLIPIGSVSKNRMDNKPPILSWSLFSPLLDLLRFFFLLFSFPKNLKHFCGSLCNDTMSRVPGKPQDTIRTHNWSICYNITKNLMTFK